ncbi:hypothetical protein B0T25DRAFT_492712 [Lasiosphaeria hispida]|uniref:NAD(P)-binding domain-containing protein n=1 Tax=Lasiosphaeria hispida TaxID=260671 RepID=A0AAJ0HVZ8_9PEZI|nr:hypothetical protein B0T25DRAFT_492712 [Lasiosphaeria hispida]
MWMMMQQPEASDYVLATGETNSVRTFCEQAFHVIGVTLKWQGKGTAEAGVLEVRSSGKQRKANYLHCGYLWGGPRFAV